MAKQVINGVPADLIEREVEKIELKHGVCHPAMLVKAAARKESPLHGLFEWDDSEAAKRYRVEQARRVIRTLRVVVDDQLTAKPSFVHVTTIAADGVANGYMATHRALEGDTRDQVLKDALGVLEGARRRYEALTELSSVWSALDEIKAGVAA